MCLTALGYYIEEIKAFSGNFRVHVLSLTMIKLSKETFVEASKIVGKPSNAIN